VVTHRARKLAWLGNARDGCKVFLSFQFGGKFVILRSNAMAATVLMIHEKGGENP